MCGSLCLVILYRTPQARRIADYRATLSEVYSIICYKSAKRPKQTTDDPPSVVVTPPPPNKWVTAAIQQAFHSTYSNFFRAATPGRPTRLCAAAHTARERAYCPQAIRRVLHYWATSHCTNLSAPYHCVARKNATELCR